MDIEYNMVNAKAVSVVGYKDSGKTKVIEGLVAELSNRGYNVGTVKHAAENLLLDTPGKDTWRHRHAGSKATAILHDEGAAFFIDKFLTINDAISKLGTLDFIVLEGFKSNNSTAKIIVPQNTKDIEELSDGLEVAVIKLHDKTVTNEFVPVIPIERVCKLADLVEEKAFPILPELDCRACGFEDCKNMAKAILLGEADFKKCVGYGSSFNLKVNDKNIPLGSFVQSALTNVVLGFIKTLKGAEEPSKVEIKFELSEKNE